MYSHSPKDLSLSVKPSGGERFSNLNSLDASAETLPPLDTRPPPTLSQETETALTKLASCTFESLIPTLSSLEQRKQFLAKIQNILDLEFPKVEIKAQLFGSTVNGLGTTSSDVDICLVTTWNDLRQGVFVIREFADRLKSYGMLRIYTISKAKVPICKFYDPEFRLNCDINVNNIMALRNTRLIRAYVDLDPRVRPLLMIIKYWAKRRALNDAAKGGTLSSYCWVMMALNFLQTRQPPILPCLHQMYFDQLQTDPAQTSRLVIDGVDCSFFEDFSLLRGFGSANTESLGALVFSFFKHFAFEFDYNHSVVSVRHGRYLTKVEKGWNVDIRRMWRYLCVEEPFNPQRNLANSADLVSVVGLRLEFVRAVELLAFDGDLVATCDRFNMPQKSYQKPFHHSKSFDNGSYSYGRSTRPQYRPMVRSFGTGMYPSHHKQQQTDTFSHGKPRTYSAPQTTQGSPTLANWEEPVDDFTGTKITQTENMDHSFPPLLATGLNVVSETPKTEPLSTSVWGQVSNLPRARSVLPVPHPVAEPMVDPTLTRQRPSHRSASLNRGQSRIKAHSHSHSFSKDVKTLPNDKPLSSTRSQIFQVPDSRKKTSPTIRPLYPQESALEEDMSGLSLDPLSKKKGGKVLVWSNQSHRRGRDTNSTGTTTSPPRLPTTHARIGEEEGDAKEDEHMNGKSRSLSSRSMTDSGLKLDEEK